MEKRIFAVLTGLLLCVGMAMAQVQVRGTIIGADDGEPLPNASVKILGSKTGTTTNINGEFVLTVPDANTRLEISHIGMLPRVVKARSGMRIALDTDEKLLGEVMVIGYGTSTRSAFTGSAVEIKSEDITSHVTATATSALVGKVAGIQATSSSGAPGSAPIIRIRGIGSYSASSEPLYVIDGVPMQQGLASVNPQDIESMSVLKDASASAIYGNRGANGVIIITTKKAKGAAQDAEVKFDARVGSNSRLIPRYNLITNPAQYYETHYRAMYNSVAYNGGTAEEAYAFADGNLFNQNNGGLGYQVFTVPDGEKFIGTNFKLNPNATLGYFDGTYYYTPDNWYDENIHSALRQEYNASVSGNTGRLSYYASAGYLNDGGQVDNSEYNRYTGRTNVEYQAKKWLRLTTNMSFTHSESQSPSYSSTYGSSTNLFYYANMMGAIYPMYVRDAAGNILVENGRKVYDNNTNTNFRRPNFIGNAARDNQYDQYRGYGDTFFGQWGATITPVTGLNLSANLSTSSINNRSTSLGSRFGSSSGTDGQASVSSSRFFAVTQQYLANYTHTFADVHNLGIVAGYEQTKEKDQGISASNTHLFDPFIGEVNNAVGPQDHIEASSSTDNYMTEGYLARATYDYAERYFANASIRRDASSKFAPGHRWGTFWSAGLAWQLNKEQFLANAKWVDLLKLKVSYGEMGNDQGMGWHAYADRFSTSFNSETNAYGITMLSKGNDDLTWETKKAWNAGIDFSFFNYRLNGTIEVYTGTTSDLLWSKTVPLSSGLTVTSFPANVGSLRNSGIEVSIDGDIVRTRNVKWNINLAVGHNKNKIIELDPSIAEKGLRYSNSIIRVGGSLQHAYMVKYAGVDPETGRAMYWKAYTSDASDPTKLVALTNTYGEGPIVKEEKVYDITDASRYDLGDILPKVNGGFGTTFEAYGFDFAAQFSYQLGGKTYDGGYQALMHNGQQTGYAMHKDLLNAWTPENRNTDVPRLSTAAIDDPGVNSQTPYSRFLTKSNYLCLSNLTLGYTLPTSIVRPLTLKSVRLYVAGENLFLLTARRGLDPRYNLGIGSMTSGQGLSSGSYSAMRSITGGITVTF